VRIEGMVWKREIASWKEGLADKRREEKRKESNGGKPMVREDMHPVRFWRRGDLWFIVVLQLLWVVVK